MDWLKIVIASKIVSQSSLAGGRGPLDPHTFVPVLSVSPVQGYCVAQLNSQVVSGQVSGEVAAAEMRLCADGTASQAKVVRSMALLPTVIEEVLSTVAPAHGTAVWSRATRAQVVSNGVQTGQL